MTGRVGRLDVREFFAEICPWNKSINPVKTQQKTKWHYLVEFDRRAQTPQTIEWVHLSAGCQDGSHERFDIVSILLGCDWSVSVILGSDWSRRISWEIDIVSPTHPMIARHLSYASTSQFWGFMKGKKCDKKWRRQENPEIDAQTTNTQFDKYCW